MNKDATSAKRNIVASIEAMPEGTEEEYSNCAVNTIIDDVAKPIRGGTIPVV
jgi:hypothetical protein